MAIPPILTNVSRRTFLAAGVAGLSALSARVAIGAASPGFFRRHDLPIGVQLYTVSDAARIDLDGTLDKIARMGYRTVELAGFHGHDVRTLRASADRAGLQYTSIHIGAQAPQGAPSLNTDIPKLCAELRVLGVARVVLPMYLTPAQTPAHIDGESFTAYIARVAERLQLDDWKRTAAFLNKKGAELRREGFPLSYHNHNPEFRAIGDTNGFDTLMRETQADLVSFELDVGWAVAGGADPSELLKRYRDRFRQMHVKDILPGTRTNYSFQQDPTEVGQGCIPWPALLRTAYEAGVRQFFVEQEPPFTKDRFDAIGESLAYLLRLT